MLATIFEDAGNRIAPDDYPLERQLAIAQRRLTESVAAARKARDEFDVMETTGARVEAIRVARARMEAATVLRRRFEAIVRRLQEQVNAVGR